MSKRRLHPERVLMVLLGGSVPTVWALGLAGFLSGNGAYYRWAVGVLGVTLAVAFVPLIAFVITLAIEKFRGKRHD